MLCSILYVAEKRSTQSFSAACFTFFCLKYHGMAVYLWVRVGRENAGLKITAGQRTMSGLIEVLTGQMFDLPVMLTGQN